MAVLQIVRRSSRPGVARLSARAPDNVETSGHVVCSKISSQKIENKIIKLEINFLFYLLCCSMRCPSAPTAALPIFLTVRRMACTLKEDFCAEYDSMYCFVRYAKNYLKF